MEKIGTMIALAKALGTPNDTQVNSAVSAWLAAHPEATTTVTDGSITNAKLASSFVTPGTAAAYSSSATYAVGDYCFHNGSLYRCTTAITTAEAWTAEHWTAVALGNDVSDLKSSSSSQSNAVGLTKTSDKSDLFVRRCITNSDVESVSGTRIRNIYHITGNKFEFSVQCSYGSGLDIALYSTLSKAVKADSNYITLFTDNYTTSTVKGTVTNTDSYLSISQKKSNSSAITDSEKASFYENLVFSGLETFENADTIVSLEERTIKGIDNALAIKKNYEGSSYSSNGNTSYLPCFVHLTDIHGDKERVNTAIKVAKLLGADCILNSGDNVYYYNYDPLPYSFPTEVLMLPTIGNHDANSNTLENMSAKQIVPADDESFVFDNVSNPTYYYKDFPSKKIRVIVLNQFETGSGTSIHYSQSQIDFLTASLLSTPQNYGVILMYHKPEYIPSIATGYEKFSQSVVGYQNISTMKPITEIVDAFISGSSINETYSNDDGTGTVTATADFSTKNTGVEFIAHVNGHEHYDRIGYLPTTNKQLNLNAVCTNAWTNLTVNGYSGTSYPEFNEVNDLARVIGTETENAFNVYVIDRSRKEVRVARIGADMPAICTYKRDCMAIPYAD